MTEIKKPPDKSLDFFKCVKIPLKHVLKNPNINLPKITNAVIKSNKIVINTLMFMKLYLLDYFDKNKKLPEIDKIFVNSCMKILCNESASGRPPKKEIKELKDKLTTFYNSSVFKTAISFNSPKIKLSYLLIAGELNPNSSTGLNISAFVFFIACTNWIANKKWY